MPRRYTQDDDGPDYSGGLTGDPGTPSNPAALDRNDPTVQAIIALYKKYGLHDPSDAEITSHLGNPKGLEGVEQTIKDSPEYKGLPKTTPPPTDSGKGGGGGGPHTGMLADLLKPYGGTFTPPDTLNLGGPKGIEYIPPVPTLNLPEFQQAPAFSYADFKAPTYEEAQNDPGYQFAVGQGRGQMETSAAARGVTNTGGTLRDIVDYGQKAGAQQYNNVFNRDLTAYGTNRQNALDTYQTNYQTQYVDPYQAAYKRASDMYQPLYGQWQTQAQAGQRQNEMNYSNRWNEYLQGYNQWRNFNNDRYNYVSGALGMQ